MNLKPEPFASAMLLTLLVGATLGSIAIAVALTTPKTGKDVQEILKGFARRLNARGRAMDPYEDEEPVAMFI